MARKRRRKETEFNPVPLIEQLDTDEEGIASDSDAFDEASGNDADDLEIYRDRDGPVWAGPE